MRQSEFTREEWPNNLVPQLICSPASDDKAQISLLITFSIAFFYYYVEWSCFCFMLKQLGKNMQGCNWDLITAVRMGWMMITLGQSWIWEGLVNFLVVWVTRLTRGTYLGSPELFRDKSHKVNWLIHLSLFFSVTQYGASLHPVKHSVQISLGSYVI